MYFTVFINGREKKKTNTFAIMSMILFYLVEFDFFFFFLGLVHFYHLRFFLSIEIFFNRKYF